MFAALPKDYVIRYHIGYFKVTKQMKSIIKTDPLLTLSRSSSTRHLYTFHIILNSLTDPFPLGLKVIKADLNPPDKPPR